MSIATDPEAGVLKQAAASGAPALMWALVGCPFDVIKTRLQTATVPFASPLHCLAWTARREGVRALWKGFAPQLLVSTPYSVIMFGVYDSLRPSQSGRPAERHGVCHIAGCFVAGAASGVAVTAVHNPLEVWRVRVQTHLPGGGSGDGGGSSRSSRRVLSGLLRRPWQLGRGGSMTLLENTVGNG